MGIFQKILGLFRFITKEICLFRLFRYRFETPKKNRIFFFLVSRNKPKQMRNRSCFGLFRFEPKFIFVCFEDTLFKAHIHNSPSLLCCFVTSCCTQTYLTSRSNTPTIHRESAVNGEPHYTYILKMPFFSFLWKAGHRAF
jgi:hypothetical protein